jgi:hypothetical protein
MAGMGLARSPPRRRLSNAPSRIQQVNIADMKRRRLSITYTSALYIDHYQIRAIIQILNRPRFFNASDEAI